MTAHGPGRTLPPSSPTQDKYLKEDPDADSGVTWAEAAGGGLSPARPVTTETTADPYSNDGGTMNVTVAADDGPLWAVKREGDAFPRIIFMSDPTDAIFYVGDGTFDPTSGPEIWYDPTTQALRLSKTAIFGDLEVTNFGSVIIHSANGTGFRLVVANDGTLSAEAV